MKNLGTVKLESKNLILRRIYLTDAKQIYEGFVNQEGFLYYANKTKRTYQQQIDSLKGIDEKYKRLDYYNWLITLKTNDDVIGSINANVNEDSVININYAIDDRYKNNGFATEALLLIKDFFLNEVKVSSITLGCVPSNIASKKVMEKCGFIHIKTLKKHIVLKDGNHDMLVYSIKK